MDMNINFNLLEDKIIDTLVKLQNTQFTFNDVTKIHNKKDKIKIEEILLRFYSLKYIEKLPHGGNFKNKVNPQYRVMNMNSAITSRCLHKSQIWSIFVTVLSAAIVPLLSTIVPIMVHYIDYKIYYKSLNEGNITINNSDLKSDQRLK